MKRMTAVSIAVFIAISVAVVSGCSQPGGESKPVIGVQSIGYNTVRSVFAAYCSSCHPSRSAPDWLDYSQAVDYVENGSLHRRVIAERSMPPPGSAEAASMSEFDRQIVARWIQAGAPQEVSGEVETATPDVIQSCMSCHGVMGPQPSVDNYIPRLGGQKEEYLNLQMRLYKTFDRIDLYSEMNRIAQSLSDAQIELVSSYFSRSQSMETVGLRPFEVNAIRQYERGRALAAISCDSCHTNPSADGLVPVLVGQSTRYLVNQLMFYQKGIRENSLMQAIASQLSREAMNDLALYYSMSPPPAGRKIIQPEISAPANESRQILQETSVNR